MSNFAWYGLQIVVAVAMFVLIGETVGLEGFGLAPAFVSMGVAFGVTQSISATIDGLRRWRVRPPPLPSSAFTVSHELKRDVGGLRGIAHSGDSSELGSRPRIGHYPRKPL